MNMMMRLARCQQAEERRAQLLATALEVFAAKGLDGATVKDLSDAAGVAQGLLYHYFQSKEELLRAVLDQHYFLPELRRIAAADPDRPVAEVLLEIALGFAHVLEQNRRVVQLMLREAPSMPRLRSASNAVAARGCGCWLTSSRHASSRVS